VTNLWQKIFGKKTPKEYTEEDTIPIKPPETFDRDDEITKPLTPLSNVFSQFDDSEKRVGVEPSQLLACCAQSVGRQRDHNEDAMFCLTTTLSSNGSTMPIGIYIVADGMGGHQHGEVASEIAIRTMADYVIRHIFTNLIGNKPAPPEEPLQEIMKKGVQVAHDNILKAVSGGGTTLTTVIIIGNQMTIAHVGDSRIYTVSLNGRMKPLTRDHSLVKRLEELGQLTPEEAAVDPRRNVLYHALGQGTPLEPEIISAPLPQPGYLLVCSDGLWGVISEEEIGKILKSADSLPKACQELVDAANAAGGPDNITAILIRLPD
jgi:serine/threonine protein phosphatase PrpC